MLEEKLTARARLHEGDVIFAPRVRRGLLSLQVAEDSAGAVGMKNGCGGGRVYPKLAGRLAGPMHVQHQRWYLLVAVVVVGLGMDHRHVREGETGTIIGRRRLYMAE